jgi:hypothetical protein
MYENRKYLCMSQCLYAGLATMLASLSPKAGEYSNLFLQWGIIWSSDRYDHVCLYYYSLSSLRTFCFRLLMTYIDENGDVL